jgi:hypothetical protein
MREQRLTTGEITITKYDLIDHSARNHPPYSLERLLDMINLPHSMCLEERGTVNCNIIDSIRSECGHNIRYAIPVEVS